VKKILQNIIKNIFPLNSYFYQLDLDQKYHPMQGNKKSYFQNIIKNLTLSELFILFRTDKAKIYENLIFVKQKYFRSLIAGHDYSKIYEFTKRSNVKNIIEIGSYYGSSSAAFASYFYKSKVYCIDLDFSRNFVKSSRIVKILCDQSDRILLIENIKKYNLSNKIDFVSDDGIHNDKYILRSLNTLFLFVKRGGFYVIEDISKEKNPIIYNLFISKKKFNKERFISRNIIKNFKKIQVFESKINKDTQSKSNQNFVIRIIKKN